MLLLTKIFQFEMAHALLGYAGVCKNIHGHSYKLHITVTSGKKDQDYIPAPGFIMDFKELKELVITHVIKIFDHKLVLSHDYVAQYPDLHTQGNLVIWEVEPSAENLLIFIQRTLSAILPSAVKLAEIKLYETSDSYGRWINTGS